MGRGLERVRLAACLLLIHIRGVSMRYQSDSVKAQSASSDFHVFRLRPGDQVRALRVFIRAAADVGFDDDLTCNVTVTLHGSPPTSPAVANNGPLLMPVLALGMRFDGVVAAAVPFLDIEVPLWLETDQQARYVAVQVAPEVPCSGFVALDIRPNR